MEFTYNQKINRAATSQSNSRIASIFCKPLLLIFFMSSTTAEENPQVKSSAPEILEVKSLILSEKKIMSHDENQEQLTYQSAPKIEKTKDAVYQKAVIFANWVDNFFGEQQELNSAGYDYLHLVNNFVFRQGESPEFRPRVKARIQLPRLSKRTSLLFSNDRAADNKDFATSEIERSNLDDDDKNELSAAINYQAKSSRKTKLDFRLGLDSSLDIFAFVRHRTPLVEHDRLNIENSNYLFWEEEKGYGAATEFEMNKVLDEESLFRWKYSILRAEKSLGNEWRNRFTLVNHLAEFKWITYDFSIKGSSELDFDVEQYRFAVRYRKRTPIHWIYLEVEPDLRFERNERYPERELIAGITVRLEIQFEKQ